MKNLSDKKFLEITDTAIKDFHGSADDIAKAVGMLESLVIMVGRLFILFIKGRP